MPTDRLLTHGTFEPNESGYEVRLPSGEEYWTLANEFAEEEAACYASLGLDIEEQDAGIVLRASF